MLYAVSVETSRAIRHGRMRRRERVYVDARDGDEARTLALQRFRHLRRRGRAGPRDLVVADIRRVDLEKPRPTPAPPPPRAAKPSVPNPKKPRRPKKRRPRKTGASKR